jgi:dinuclear metal center YbgI/SA1388 family protein
MNAKNIIKIIESYFPLSYKEEWDNVGLLVGTDNIKINKILFCVNVSDKNIDFAIKNECNFIFSHHPLIFNDQKNITNTTDNGKKIIKLIKNNINVYSAHTNADIAKNGVCDYFMQKLGIQNSVPIAPFFADKSIGTGRYGNLKNSIKLIDLTTKINELIPKTVQGILASDTNNKIVKTIAFCGGAGDSLLNFITNLNKNGYAIDAYITGDLRFHPAYQFKLDNPQTALINLNHSASEYLWLENFSKILQAKTNTKILITKNVDDVWQSIK